MITAGSEDALKCFVLSKINNTNVCTAKTMSGEKECAMFDSKYNARNASYNRCASIKHNNDDVVTCFCKGVNCPVTEEKIQSQFDAFFVLYREVNEDEAHPRESCLQSAFLPGSPFLTTAVPGIDPTTTTPEPTSDTTSLRTTTTSTVHTTTEAATEDPTSTKPPSPSNRVSTGTQRNSGTTSTVSLPNQAESHEDIEESTVSAEDAVPSYYDDTTTAYIHLENVTGTTLNVTSDMFNQSSNIGGVACTGWSTLAVVGLCGGSSLTTLFLVCVLLALWTRCNGAKKKSKKEKKPKEKKKAKNSVKSKVSPNHSPKVAEPPKREAEPKQAEVLPTKVSRSAAAEVVMPVHVNEENEKSDLVPPPPDAPPTLGRVDIQNFDAGFGNETTDESSTISTTTTTTTQG